MYFNGLNEGALQLKLEREIESQWESNRNMKTKKERGVRNVTASELWDQPCFEGGTAMKHTDWEAEN